MSSDQFIPLVVDIIEAIGIIVTLAFGVQAIRSNTKSRVNQSVNETYTNFQELQLSLLSDPKLLDILSRELGKDSDALRQSMTASLLINNAYKIYWLYTEKLLPEDLWIRSEADMKELFAWQFIQNRWRSMQSLYPRSFQEFIFQKIQPHTDLLNPK